MWFANLLLIVVYAVGCFVEVHYNGVIIKVEKKKRYVGGKIHLIKDFFINEWL